MSKLLSTLRLLYSRMFSSIGILSVDFHHPWWAVIMRQKKQLVMCLSGEIISGIFSPLRIFILGYIFSVQRFDYFIYLFVSWALVWSWCYVGRLFATVLKVRSVYSVQYHAHRVLLQIDPIYHTNRVSGLILGKIERAGKSYEEFLEFLVQPLFLHMEDDSQLKYQTIQKVYK